MSERSRKTSIVDQPKKHDSKDQFGIDSYQKALINFIRHADTPITIALQGEWGSGKTSLMNTLAQELTDRDGAPYHKVWINTWQFSLMRSPEEAVVMILSGIIGQIGAAIKNHADQSSALHKYFGRWVPKGEAAKEAAKLGTKFVLNVVGNIGNIDKLGNSVVDAVEKDGATASESEISALKNGISGLVKDALSKSGRSGFIFFIDDLDRIDPPVAVQILELLKNIFDLEKCVFVLAIDYDVVIKGLKPKFGELTDKNEREFRSFFDKIIQLPFSMPVGSYKIDEFLIQSIKEIGFVTEEDAKIKDFTIDLSEFARLSVGRNPRSLKRLTNILSLINLLNGADSKALDEGYEKLVNFALVCLQISYPAIYNHLVAEPDFKNWHETIVKRMQVEPLSEAETERLNNTQEFDEPWEKALYQLCQRDGYLKTHAFDISRILNKILLLIPKEKGENPGDVVAEIIQLSAVTNLVAGETRQPGNFNHSDWLKRLNGKLLPRLEKTVPPEFSPAQMPQRRVQSKLHYCFKGGDGLVAFGIRQSQYVLNWGKGDWLLWGECANSRLEDELKARGGTREEFESFVRAFADLAKKHGAAHHDGGGFPEVWQKCGSKMCFVYGNQYAFAFDSLEDAVSDAAVEKFAAFIIDFLSVRDKMIKLLQRLVK